MVRAVLEDALGDLVVEGELSNVHRHRSGHLYATLKDAGAQLRLVVWRGDASRLAFTPRDGMQVRVRGRMSFYAARGEAQLVGHAMTLAGAGALAAAFDALRRDLAAEGLFDDARKRPLPAFPRVVGVVTSPEGAAVRDVLAILAERFPVAEVFVCGVKVQGTGASAEIADALAAFGDLDPDDPMRPDVLIVGRGGGSAEDLWAFNEEAVVRAIAACPIPVVSAVGHETDVTLSDFAADVRAATPSHAAQRVVPDQREIAALLAGTLTVARDRLRLRLGTARVRLHALTGAPAMQRVPARIADARRNVERVELRLAAAIAARLVDARARLAASTAALAPRNPTAPLRLGYARIAHADGRRARAGTLSAGDTVHLDLPDGHATARITAVETTVRDDALTARSADPHGDAARVS